MKKLMVFVVAALMAVAFAGTAGAQGVTPFYGPQPITLNGDVETPVIALDSKGNAHIVWSGTAVGEDFGGLYYRMVDPGGKILIGTTILNPAPGFTTSYHVRRPSIAIDDTDAVHIAYHSAGGVYTGFDQAAGIYTGSAALLENEVLYTKINPYLGAMNGDTADLTKIVVIPEKVISGDDGVRGRAANIVYDRADNTLKVAWWQGPSGAPALYHSVLDLSGVTVISGTTLTPNISVDVDWGEAEIAVDRDGNAHIVYCTDQYDLQREIYYTMVRQTGTSPFQVLIAPSRITPNDNIPTVRAFVATDSQSNVHVIYHSSSGATREVYYSALVPSRAPLSGTTVAASVISAVSHYRLTPDDGLQSNQKNLFVDGHDLIHFVYTNGDEWDFNEARDLYYTEFATSVSPFQVNVLQAPFALTSGATEFKPASWYESSSGRDPVVVATGVTAYVVFNGYDDRTGYTDVWLAGLHVDLPAATYNASDIWRITITNQTGNCDLTNEDAEVSQVGSNVTVKIDGITLTGTVSGANYEASGTQVDSVTGEVTRLYVQFTLDSNSMGSGAGSFVVTDAHGDEVCQGTVEFDFTREGAPAQPGSSGGCFISTIK